MTSYNRTGIIVLWHYGGFLFLCVAFCFNIGGQGHWTKASFKVKAVDTAMVDRSLILKPQSGTASIVCDRDSASRLERLPSSGRGDLSAFLGDCF